MNRTKANDASVIFQRITSRLTSFSKTGVETIPQNASGQTSLSSPSKTVNVSLLGDEWSSSAGGLSTINRELGIHLSQYPGVKVSLLCPEGACINEEKLQANAHGITIVEAKERAAYGQLDWLISPPEDHEIDVVVGHSVKLGRQVQFIKDSPRFRNCKWVQVVHTAPEELGIYKCYDDPISKGETKHKAEIELCKLADLVVPVGPRLEENYTSYLKRCKTDEEVFSVTPGIFHREFGDLKQTPNEHAEFKVLLLGRGDDEDFELKGYDIAGKAFNDQRLKNNPYHLLFVGAPEGKQEEVGKKLLQYGIDKAQLTVRKFIQKREEMKDLLSEVDLAIMPSKSEGFGLAALEALSAGLPILVGRKSGIAKALKKVPHGDACIVNTDDPAKWAHEIEAVRHRHQLRLEEIKALKACYDATYNWNDQINALVKKMWKMVHGTSHCRISEKIATSAIGNEGSSCNPGITKACYEDLSNEQRQTVHGILQQQVQAYFQFHNISTKDEVSGLCAHIQNAHSLALESVGVGSPNSVPL